MFTEKKLEKKNVMAVIIAVIIIAGAIFWVFCKNSFFAAKVDGSYITRAAFEREFEKQSGGKRVLDAMVTELLVEKELKKNGIVVSDEEIEEAIKKLKASVTVQGSTFEDFLSAQGISEADLKQQMWMQKGVEKLLADKVQVTEEELAKHMMDNKITLPKENPEEMKTQIREQIRNQKLNAAAEPWIAGLKTGAKIESYLGY
ncbi:SurA N-terminal domain-containing protein [bacterium]|nr:SurA N-terminal domain-containing protein [bacterium]